MKYNENNLKLEVDNYGNRLERNKKRKSKTLPDRD